ncbi:MAG: CheY-like chemotaxis protein/PAS domain-containing protein [Candidatus Azotimanducaceae bacterium]|jgi:CheY-like chemotaxis protein/PAS domain-containing protein
MIHRYRYSANGKQKPSTYRQVRIRHRRESLGMDYEDQFDLRLFDQLPVGVLTLDDDYRVNSANQFARQLLPLQPGADIRALVHPDCLEAFDLLLHNPSKSGAEIQFKFGNNSLYTKVHVPEASTLIVEDTSELVALARQLKTDKQPERKFVHELSNALTTTLGYTELISMMLEEHDEFSGERLAAVRRYEAEVFEGLKRADSIIKNKKQGAAQQFSPAIPLKRKHVVVVDDEAQITEFLSELLRARQYKVTAFTESTEALEFYKMNWEQVDLVIMDQVMPEMSGIMLATELLAYDRSQPIVLCTGDQMLIKEQMAGKVKIRHFLSKPIDINELTAMVSNIID